MSQLTALILYEFSGTVRQAFENVGWRAISVDLLPTEKLGLHFQGSVEEYLEDLRFSRAPDIIIAHPPCTYLSVSGNRWYAGTEKRAEAVKYTSELWQWLTRLSSHVCLENPVGALSRALPVQPQYVQPWQFGNPESKKTGLWLRGLPPLEPTHPKPSVIETKVWYMSPGPNRQKDRSRFFPGMAQAMAEQWSKHIEEG